MMSQATDNLANAAANTINTATDGAASAASAVANSQTLQTLDSALAQMITESVMATGDALAWAKGQIPDLINQILVWHFVSSLLIQVLCLIPIIAVVLGWRKYMKSGNEDLIPLLVAPTAFCAIPVIAFFLHFDWLKIWIAPKLYLVEYAAGLVK